MRRGAHQAAVQVARADEVIEHLGADHAGVDHARALVADAVGVARGQRRGGQAHVAPDADPQVGDGLRLEVAEHARERAAEPVGDVLVDLLAVEAADVVGLEDAGVDLRGSWAAREASAPASRAITAIRSRKSGAHMRSATPAASARRTSAPRQRAASSRRSGRGSSARVNAFGAVPHDERLVAVAAQQRGHRVAREVLHVGGDHRPPARAHQRAPRGCPRRAAPCRRRRRAAAAARSGRAPRRAAAGARSRRRARPRPTRPRARAAVEQVAGAARRGRAASRA